MFAVRKILAFIIIGILTINVISPGIVSAANDYDHENLMKYDGYGKALYETVVRETALVSGAYTDNKEYVKSSMDEIGDYAKFLYDEVERMGQNNTVGGLLGDMVSSGGAMLLTVGDWVKRLFSDKASEISPTYDFNGINHCLEYRSNTLYLTDLCSGSYVFHNGSTMTISKTSGVYISANDTNKRITVGAGGYLGSLTNIDNPTEVVKKARESKNSLLTFLYESGGYFRFIDITNNKQLPIPIKSNNHPITKVNNYIQNNEVPVVVPQLKPSLTCDNSKFNLTINGSNFYDASGNKVNVNYDGSAVYKENDCSLVWNIPEMDYINDEPVIKDPDGNWKDAEKDKIIFDETQDCDGVLCFLSKIVGAIGDIVTGLLDGLIGVFVPDDLSFITDDFEKMKTKLLVKVEIVTQLQDVMTGIFDTENSPALTYEIDMPALEEPIKMMDLEIINIGLPIFKKVMSGVLILFTLFYVYRKITGDGGLMEK